MFLLNPENSVFFVHNQSMIYHLLANFPELAPYKKRIKSIKQGVDAFRSWEFRNIFIDDIELVDPKIINDIIGYCYSRNVENVWTMESKNDFLKYVNYKEFNYEG